MPSESNRLAMTDASSMRARAATIICPHAEPVSTLPCAAYDVMDPTDVLELCQKQLTAKADVSDSWTSSSILLEVLRVSTPPFRQYCTGEQNHAGQYE